MRKRESGHGAKGLRKAVPGLIALAAISLCWAGQKQPPLPGESLSGPREGSYLYRFVMLQAGPGKLADLIELYRNRAPVIVAGGDEKPYIVKHSQGDHWDILVILPCGNMSEYYSRERVARRDSAAAAAGLSTEEFVRRLRAMVLWQEDLYVLGPPVGVFREFVKEAGLAHFEMIRSLPGKFDELVEERRMENAFNRDAAATRRSSSPGTREPTGTSLLLAFTGTGDTIPNRS